MNAVKNEVQSLLAKLPDDCTIEDIQYHLYVLDKIRQGLEAADTEGTIPQSEVEERLRKWSTK
jgi:predicted transcriptional regulator